MIPLHADREPGPLKGRLGWDASVVEQQFKGCLLRQVVLGCRPHAYKIAQVKLEEVGFVARLRLEAPRTGWQCRLWRSSEECD